MECLSFFDMCVVFLILTSILLYIYGIWPYGVWKSLGVDGPQPLPFLGNHYQLTAEGNEQCVRKWSNVYGRTFGIYVGRRPMLVTTDLDILKEVLVKYFNIFTDRFEKFEIFPDEIRAMLSVAGGEQWERIRHLLTPTFSTGKLKLMEHHFHRCSAQLTTNIKEAAGKGQKIDVRKYFAGYTLDVIAATSFGIEVNSQKDLDNPLAKDVSTILQDIASSEGLLMLLKNAFPFLTPLFKFLGMHFFQPRGWKSFLKNLHCIIQERKREGNQKEKPDFLQLILSYEEAQSSGKEELKVLSRLEVIAQATVFFVAGYETTAATLQSLAYNLALYPDVQEKIVREFEEQLGDELPTYEDVTKLKYLHSAIMETLRMYPPLNSVNRMASEEVTIKGITIPKGAGVMIPIANVMKDPEYFPEPDKFDPERFYEGSVNPVSFLAFGYGPRLCIGMRLALLEMKIAMVHVLRKVKFVKTDDLQENLRTKPGSFISFPAQVIAVKAILRDSPAAC
ncbi:cytochrome P450 3A24-like [Pomacea canaliculata]|uniref:cytochrome P450 3A24-like n=1 Tax=Pomacea canaliculata TaxID=400727 RepID=UPI000D737C4A|nr:cytochrome P450 3A24-like [Pomacea canaliculata]